uniref:Uncharacterized protein n=1 Tax=Rhizophora mucronata TaxID=61149 RepID=A0A2P2NWH5_RHIMU
MGVPFSLHPIYLSCGLSPVDPHFTTHY